MTKEATKKQLWALYCATKIDHREMGLTKEQASEKLSKLNAGRTKWTQKKVLSVVKEARRAGKIAADKKLQELQDRGPQWTVHDGPTVVGTLLDVCGWASLKISARGKFFQLAKTLTDRPVLRVYCRRAYRGGGMLSIFDSTRRQELSVNEAACRGQAKVLAKYGIKAHVISNID